MKYLFFVFIALGCSTVDNSTSVSQGAVTVRAKKYVRKSRACFDISIVSRGQQEHVELANWTAAWMDNTNRYHFLSLNHRYPTSTPKYENATWSHGLRGCAPSNISVKDVKSLVLTPKELSYNKELGSFEIQWN